MWAGLVVVLGLAWAVGFSGSSTSKFERSRLASVDLSVVDIEQGGCSKEFHTSPSPSADFFRGAGCSSQVHVGIAGARSVFIVFASPTARAESVVTIAESFLTSSSSSSSSLRGLRSTKGRRVVRGSSHTYTSVLNVSPNLLHPPMGSPGATAEEVAALRNVTAWAVVGWSARGVPAPGTTSGAESYTNPGAFYSSPVLHTVLVEGLVPGRRYDYAVGGGVGGRRRWRSFVFPRASYPFTLGLTADLGQTQGDLAYADGWTFRWDTFAALAEPLFASVPTLAIAGNHEFVGAESWRDYDARYPQPSASSQSPSNLFWSVDIGPAHVVGLNSYDNFVRGGDAVQRTWLVDDLRAVDRDKTPWLIVMMHTPLYSTNTVHVREAELMRLAYEPILYAAGVDVVLSGHVHAYERTTPVYDFEPDDCGPIYLVLGDGGNREGPQGLWFDPQPPWSAFREASFGVAKLDLVNATHARYEWNRDACDGGLTLMGVPLHESDINAACARPHDEGPKHDEHVAADAHWIVRRRDEDPENRCANQRRHWQEADQPQQEGLLLLLLSGRRRQPPPSSPRRSMSRPFLISVISLCAVAGSLALGCCIARCRRRLDETRKLAAGHSPAIWALARLSKVRPLGPPSGKRRRRSDFTRIPDDPPPPPPPAAVLLV